MLRHARLHVTLMSFSQWNIDTTWNVNVQPIKQWYSLRRDWLITLTEAQCKTGMLPLHIIKPMLSARFLSSYMRKHQLNQSNRLYHTMFLSNVLHQQHHMNSPVSLYTYTKFQQDPPVLCHYGVTDRYHTYHVSQQSPASEVPYEQSCQSVHLYQVPARPSCPLSL